MLQEFHLVESWELWTQLNSVYQSQSANKWSQTLVSARKEMSHFDKKAEERLHLANLVLAAIEELPEMPVFLNAYQSELENAEMIINSQEIDPSSENWFGERQELKQLLSEELEAKYRPTLEKAVHQLKTLPESDKQQLLNNFFAYYGRNLEMSWSEDFENLFRHSFDTFYAADLFPKVGSFNGHSYGVQAQVTQKNPEMNMIIAYSSKERRVNFSYHLYPFETREPEVKICDFSVSENPLDCQPETLASWCSRISGI